MSQSERALLVFAERWLWIIAFMVIAACADSWWKLLAIFPLDQLTEYRRRHAP